MSSPISQINSKKCTPAVKKAVTYLRSMLDNYTWIAGDMLPSINQLASAAGVSSVPMWKAVNLLAEEDILEVIQGSGTRVKKISEEPANLVRNGWMGLRDRIHKDILSGFFISGALMPSLKEMRMQYGVSYQTLRKALDCLVSEGMITPEHRTYRTVLFTPNKNHSSVVLIGWVNPQMEMQSRTPWGEEFLRECENLCSRMKVNLRILKYTASEGPLRFIDQDGNVSTKIKEDGSVLGYLMWAESPNELYRDVLNQLEQFKKPVAVLQEGSQLHLSDVVERNQGVRLFSLATGSNAARNVASYLLEQGHTDIAYISYLHKSDWSKARLCGLQEIYNRHGNGARVYPCTMDKYGFFNELSDQVKDAEHYFPTITSSMSNAGMPSMVIRVLNSIKGKFSAQMVNEVIQAYMERLFKKAASIPNISAWVCANDYMATMAIDYIKKNVDKKIALVGFDDTFIAFRNSLTSYNFNIQGLVQLMLAHILNPSADVAAKRLIPFEIEGLLVVRNTTFKKV